MRRALWLSLCLLLMFGQRADAQTVNRTIQWQHLTVPLSDVQAYKFTQQIDTGAATAITPTCVAGPPVTCTNPVSFAAGPHTITITAFSGGGQASGSTTVSPPSGPVNISISITVTVP